MSMTDTAKTFRVVPFSPEMDAFIMKRRDVLTPYRQIAKEMTEKFGIVVSQGSASGRYTKLVRKKTDDVGTVVVASTTSLASLDVEPIIRQDLLPVSCTPEPENVPRGMESFLLPKGKKTVSFSDLRGCHCHWPYENGRETLYCGAQTITSDDKVRSYCRPHFERSLAR